MSRRGSLFASIRRKFGKKQVSDANQQDCAASAKPKLTVTKPKDEESVCAQSGAGGVGRESVTTKHTRDSCDQTSDVPQLLCIPRPWPRQKHGAHHHSNSASSLTPEGVFDTYPGRPRAHSDVSASSYYTCMSANGSKRTSPTISRPESPCAPDSHSHDIVQRAHLIMNQIEARMGKLEGKIDDMRNSLESRVSELEKRLDIKKQSSPPSTVETEHKTLSVVHEESEDVEDNEEEDVQLDFPSKKVDSQSPARKPRTYTDSEVEKLSSHIERPKLSATQKSMSLQRDRLQPKEVNQKVLLQLTQTITNWKFTARWLGLTEPEIGIIEAKSRELEEQCYQMFMKWKGSDPQNYTYTVLGEALKRQSQELYESYVEMVDEVENENKKLCQI